MSTQEKDSFSLSSAELASLFTDCGSDKMGIRHRYELFYNTLFSSLAWRDSLRIVEIGVRRGASVRAMRRVFGHAEIYGIDINSARVDGVEIVVGDGYSDKTWDGIPGKFDLIIDDGSHRIEDMLRGMPYFIDRTSVGGYIVIEDVPTLEDARTLVDTFPGGSIVNMTTDARSKAADDIIVVWKKLKDRDVENYDGVIGAYDLSSGIERYILPRICVTYGTEGGSDEEKKLLLSIRSLANSAHHVLFDIVIMCKTDVSNIDDIRASVGRGCTVSVAHGAEDLIAGYGLDISGWDKPWHIACMYNLMIPVHPAYEKYSRVLFLDTDTLVWNRRVEDLMLADLGDFEVLAAPDVPLIFEESPYETLYRDIPDRGFIDEVISRTRGSVLTCAHVNSGISLWNNELIRRDTDWYERRLRVFFKRVIAGDFYFLDQSFISTLMRVNAGLSNVFNYHSQLDDRKFVIRHYSGNHKPIMYKHADEACLSGMLYTLNDSSFFNFMRAGARGRSEIRDLVDATGRDHMSVIEVGSFSGESAALFLSTGKVDKLYCVDCWAPISGSSGRFSDAGSLARAEHSFDLRVGNDSRIVKIKSTIEDAVRENKLPAHVDMVYLDASADYHVVRNHITSLIPYCDIMAGHDYGRGGVGKAVDDVYGKPDSTFCDTSWIVKDPRRRSIKVNYTAYCVNNWRTVFSDHMRLIRDHILPKYDIRLSVFAYPYSDDLFSILKDIGLVARVVVGDGNYFEFPALSDLVGNPGDLNLYLHTKGVTRDADTVGQQSAMCWNRLMSRFNIEMCDTCISKLDTCDCCGIMFWKDPRPHYSGNFWWSTGDHLRHVAASGILSNTSDRMYAEWAIGCVPGRYASLCQASIDMTKTVFDPEEIPGDDIVIEIS